MPITSNFIWTWLKGSDKAGQLGVYGAKGTPAPGNTPGARFAQILWTNIDGNFYLFGGALTSTNFFNDLWQYNPTTNQWKWVAGTSDFNQPGVYNTKGVESLTNYPGARAHSGATVGADGKFYMFGGVCPTNPPGGDVRRNDLWRFNPTNNQWTWLSGHSDIEQVGSYGQKNTPSISNVPGARNGCVLWVAQDNKLYLFGGTGVGANSNFGHLNDLWRYNLADNSWTWLSGSDGIGQFGVYGTQGTPAATNFPGARYGATGWTGKDGYLYLFGGSRRVSDHSNATDYRNDLWRFNTSDNLWTWIKGSSNFDQNGVYGTQNVAADTNVPGSRDQVASWITKAGQMFVLGGVGFPETGSRGRLDDLWMYDPVTNKWVWLKGSKLANQIGSYGIQGMAADGNQPPARDWSPGAWVAADDILYLFGGLASIGSANDVWRGTLPCDFMISDVSTFPLVVNPGQKFNLLWNIAPSIFPVNYQAIVTFNGNSYSDNFTTFPGSIALTAPGAAGVYPIQLSVISRNALNCSDMRQGGLVVTAPDTFFLNAYIPYILGIAILLYGGSLIIFLLNLFSADV